MKWTEEELREMAEADALIDQDNDIDTELSYQLDQEALNGDPTVDPRTRRKRAWNRAYYRRHRKEISAYGKAYRDAHKEELRAYFQKYEITHREERNRKKRHRYANDPEYRERCRERCRAYYKKKKEGDANENRN